MRPSLLPLCHARIIRTRYTSSIHLDADNPNHGGFIKNEYAHVNSLKDQEEKIKRLEESLERERKLGRRYELIETQNEKQLLAAKFRKQT